MKYLLDIALDASEAAVDIYNLEYNSPAIKKVINFLRYDELDFEMWANAIYPNKEDWKGKKVDNLKLQICLFKKDLELLSTFPYEKREILMNACVDLSKSAVKQFEELRSYLAA